MAALHINIIKGSSNIIQFILTSIPISICVSLVTLSFSALMFCFRIKGSAGSKPS